MQQKLLFRVRCLVAFFIFGLVVSGVTAFPLLHELEILSSILGISPDGIPGNYTGLQFWIALVREGLRETYAKYPFFAYGTDWLAFGHIIIALFFIPVFRDPVRYVANLWMGVLACILVIPLALICGPIRGIPFYWQLIDSSFGVIGIIPLIYCLRSIRRIAGQSPREQHGAAPALGECLKTGS